VSGARLTKDKALQLFEQSRQRKGHMPSTIALELRLVRAALAAIGRAVGAITKEDLLRYLALRAARVRATSAERETTVLRAFFATLVELGQLACDPTTDVPVLPAGKPRPPLVLARAAVLRLFAQASIPPQVNRGDDLKTALALRNRALVELLYGLGLRAAEVAAACVTDLDLATGELLVRRVKRGPSRTFPLPPAAVPHLDVYLRDGRPHLARSGNDRGRLLVTERGTPLTGNHVLALVKALARRAGVQCHPHALRRSLATHLVQDGAMLPAVQALLGHARLDTTQRYVAVCQHDLRKAVDALERPS